MSFELPPEFLKRYRDDKYIYRLPFLLNDRVDEEELLEKLQTADVNHKTDVLMGVAGFRILNILANYGVGVGRPFNKVILFDANAAQIKAIHAVMLFIKESDTPKQFVEKYIPYHLMLQSKVPRLGHHRQTSEDHSFFSVFGRGMIDKDESQLADYFKAEMDKGYSWLWPKKFDRVKGIIEAGDIETAIIDLRDPVRVGALKNFFTENKLRLGAFYNSSLIGFHENPFDYYGKKNSPANKQQFFDNISALTDDTTKIICSVPAKLLGIDERMFILTNPSKKDFYNKFKDFKAADDDFLIFSHGKLTACLTCLSKSPGVFAILLDSRYKMEEIHLTAFKEGVKAYGFSPIETKYKDTIYFVPLSKERLAGLGIDRQLSSKELINDYQKFGDLIKGRKLADFSDALKSALIASLEKHGIHENSPSPKKVAVLPQR